MKKVLFFMTVLAILATSCSKKDNKSTSLNYYDTDPIELVLQGTHHINATADYDISYTILNTAPHKVLEMKGNGTLYGFNVGRDSVWISNGYEGKKVGVVVDLFTQPTFEFGCSSARLRELYGSPTVSGYVDTVLIYKYTSETGYSYACGEMDFFLTNGAYYESDVYIRPSVEYLMNNYLNEKFTLDSIYGDTMEVYRYKLDNDIVCGKFASGNQWNEWCLFYIKLNGQKSVANILKRRPRSSKFLY